MARLGLKKDLYFKFGFYSQIWLRKKIGISYLVLIARFGLEIFLKDDSHKFFSTYSSGQSPLWLQTNK